MSAIKIVATPPGEAPQHIREAWVGLVLPLAAPSVRNGWVGGVLTGPRTYGEHLLRRLLGQGRRETGYLVNVAVAVSLLERLNPSAAGWWRENAPNMVVPGRNFMFSAGVCEETDEAIWPPPPGSSAT